jgi:hypothetical protein
MRSPRNRLVVSAVMAVLFLAAAVGAQASQAFTYTGSLTLPGNPIGYHNGHGGYGEFLIYSALPDLGDNDDNTGVYFPGLSDYYGNPVAGTFGVSIFDDNRIAGNAQVISVEAWFRIRCATSTGNEMQTFVHRHNDPAFSEPYQWGNLTWQAQPWNQSPMSPPIVGNQWSQSLWTDVYVHYTQPPQGGAWTREQLFKACYGIWARVPTGGGLFLSEWRLTINVQ